MADNGGFPMELDGQEWVLPSGARFRSTFCDVHYTPAPQHARERAYWQIVYLTKRIGHFDRAVAVLKNICEGQELQRINEEQNRLHGQVIDVPTFTWDVKLLGPHPAGSDPKVALAAAVTRRRVLLAKLAALRATPEGADLQSHIGFPSNTRR